ncbi:MULTISPECIES: J domain-containing protein [unclassified Bradyrhizobium]|uniref:J domain-containing protein n=1 Tax=unclassified Bradyrhizobium TaxID=2631580 RepID=UPI0028ED433D|nr:MULTISPECIES: tetratricopeptide repeat protein [unclassified Bradyrhizobium]
MTMKTHYEVLGVSPCADIETIKQAFRKAVKAHHPDLRRGHDADADRHVKMIIAAYRVLRDAGLRAEYDGLLAEARERARLERWNAIVQFTAMAAVLSIILIGLEVLFLPSIRDWVSIDSIRSMALRLQLQSRSEPAHEPSADAASAWSAQETGAVPPAAHRAETDDHDLARTPRFPLGVAPAQDMLMSLSVEEPSTASAFLERALDFSRKGELDRAIADFDAAIRLAPANAEAYGDRARGWSRKGDLDRALADYDQAIRLDPKNPGLFHDRALIRQQRGEFDEALLDLDHAVRMSFSDADVYSDRGAVWLAKGRYDRALADLDRALALNPQLPSALARRNAALARKRELAGSGREPPPAPGTDMTSSVPKTTPGGMR